MNEKQSFDRILYPDILRIFATFMVVLLHVNASKWYTSPVTGFNWQIMNIYGALTRSSVPLFFMISGMFLLNPDKEITVKYILRKILRTIFALLIFEFFYESFWAIGNKIVHHTADSIFNINFFWRYFSNLLFEPYYHLWFLYSIIGLYLLTPILRVLIKNFTQNDYKYLILVCIIFGLLMNLINETLHYKKSESLFLEISEFSGYGIYYIAGYYFSKFDIKTKKCNVLILLGFIALALTILFTSIISTLENKANPLLYGYLLPGTFFEAVSFFLLIRKFCDNKKLPLPGERLISKISKLTFGVYLVHDIFLTLLWKFNFTIELRPPFVIFIIPFFSVLVFLSGTALSYFLSKFPFFKKILL